MSKMIRPNERKTNHPKRIKRKRSEINLKTVLLLAKIRKSERIKASLIWTQPILSISGNYLNAPIRGIKVERWKD